jgi:hypothetical protein
MINNLLCSLLQYVLRDFLDFLVVYEGQSPNGWYDGLQIISIKNGIKKEETSKDVYFLVDYYLKSNEVMSWRK